jgi:hypothetical protein
MTSKRKPTEEIPHNDELDAEIDWLLYRHGPEAVREAVARRSRKKPGEESKYLPTAMEEIDLQITNLLSSQSKIKIPTRNSIKEGAISRLSPEHEGALEIGLRRCLNDRTDIIFVRIDILGSYGDFSYMRFHAVLEKYVSQKKPDDSESKFAQSRIARIDEARDEFRQRFGALPPNEWSLARIEDATRQSKGVLTLLSEQLAAEKSKVGSR